MAVDLDWTFAEQGKALRLGSGPLGKLDANLVRQAISSRRAARVLPAHELIKMLRSMRTAGGGGVDVVSVQDDGGRFLLNVGLMFVRSTVYTRQLMQYTENRTWAGWEQGSSGGIQTHPPPTPTQLPPA